MERDGDQGPDTASIKPVSSLRAKFENPQTPNPSGSDGTTTKQSTPGLRPVDPSKQPPATVRASFDLPRPQSPWSTQQIDIQNGPRTPGPAPRGSESPSRSNHKRPLSMLIQSSPKLTPSVQVDSPKSPPRTLFARPKSRSPERNDTTPFGKVKALVSQHGSRSSSKPPTPGDEIPDPTSNSAPIQPTVRPKSPIPPPINRADKPKVPAKPLNIASTPNSDLSARPLSFLNERRVSPFSTPPSSDEEQAPVEPQRQSGERRSVDVLGRSAEGLVAQTTDAGIHQSQRDPRSLGFSQPKTNTERRDPRQLGFTTEPPRPPSREAKSTPLPTRSTPPATTAPPRDPRELGFGASTPTNRQTAPSMPQNRASPPKPETLPQQGSHKDARMLGFSEASLPSTLVEPARPDLLQRTIPRIPPPRPTEDSKRPTYAPGIMKAPPAPRVPSITSSTTPARRSEDVPRQAIPSSSDVRFPPPPKRETFHNADFEALEPSNIPPSLPSRRRSFDVNPPIRDDSDDAEDLQPEPVTTRHDYPDGSHTNRRPPQYHPKRWQFYTKTDGKAFDICGRLYCTASYHTRILDLETGEEVLALNHGETVKQTAVIFKPGADIKSEGKRIWIGNNIGDLQEIDLESHATIATSSAHNRTEILRIMRHQKDVWTLDEAGKLFVWEAGETGVPSMKNTPISHKLSIRPTHAMVVQDTLWAMSGKEVRVYRPGRDSTFNVHKGPLQTSSSAGDVTCGTFSEAEGKVYLGHTDGKVTMYSLKDHSCLGSMKISDYKINSMTMVGKNLWAVYKTGKVYVYDISTTPWQIKKDWKAHEGPATGIVLDRSSVWLLGRVQVATTGHDQHVRLWDGMLEDDWVENRMHERDIDYCTFRTIRASVTTWNCGATNPALLRTDFIADAIHADEPSPPEILVFGFQEVVDLEDRTVTAKSILGFGKKKENKAADQQYQSRVYRDWRDYLARSINKYIPQHEYTELHTSSLIGLLQCVFVRANERRNVTNHAGSDVKCGMGGHYGNKGALLCRFVLDSSSLCFINCHLAAGQSHTSHRNNDVATILEAESLPSELDVDVRTNHYVGGGDGTQILDHEVCILNGDLNYRIDTMSRATVVKQIESGDLSKLLERDQLNVSRRRVAGFRLAPFTELPITFPPTYKYDVGSDRYDSSDKKRSPAWCDRLLFRSSAGRVKQLEYRRHERVYYSDHRPVSGIFKLQIKKVDEAKRKQTLKSVYAEFEKTRKGILEEGCVSYLVECFGIGREEARRLFRSAE
ncbi:hypothetical protein LTS08_004601 [Lithohypha guttulata]|uniref:uncharacterized protein n=1 Tax=Lithohypha guttulata TaxID=1690604 RepID=UPI002DE1073E|nr:hypothetical protein LTR51_006138 [Lithohypha guttulata]KAK5100995.1 hypothetical protein LTS08_004601 [Lithohypha guttulata]